MIGLAWPYIPNHDDIDSQWYIALSEGRLQDIYKPFAYRLLHPYLIYAISTIGVGTDAAFRLTGMMALVVLSTSVVRLASLSGWQGLIVLPFITPPLFTLFRDYYLPDLFHAALMGLFLLAYGPHPIVATILLAALQLTRESTILLAAVVIIAAWRTRQYGRLALSAAATIVVVLLVDIVTKRALSNVHAMSDLAYLALKVPYNGTRNLLGVEIWTNTSNSCEPWLLLPSPALGNLTAVGLCDWSPWFPVVMARVMLTSFGIAPILLTIILLRHGRPALNRLPPAVKIAIGYGVLAFLITPFIGASVARYAAYAWPAFWVGVPVLLSRHFVDSKALIWLPLLHVAIAWAPWWVPSDTATQMILVASVAVTQMYVVKTLGRALWTRRLGQA